MSVEEKQFVKWFRGSAPYIHAHRGKTFVIVFGGELLESDALSGFVQDVALLSSLGIRLVLVAGARPQIDKELRLRKKKSKFVDGLRLTDRVAIECVKAATGFVRTEMEAQLSMGLSNMPVSNSPMSTAKIRVAAGNFVTAKPMGVIEGVDFQFTGKVRKVDVDAIEKRLDDGSVVLLSSIGYSSTGEVFNLSSPEVAASTSIALKADKLICLTEGKGFLYRGKRLVKEITTEELERMMTRKTRLDGELLKYLNASIVACEGGVDRAHVVGTKHDGRLLLELFTREGWGTLISKKRFEAVRQAELHHVPGLLALIQPLEKKGVLKERSEKLLERDIDRFFVMERDGLVVGCFSLYVDMEHRAAEFACLVVHPEYQGSGRADELLRCAEDWVRELGAEHLVVLTTQTAHWFQERGFRAGSLPRNVKPFVSKRRSRRRSKVLFKKL